MMAVNTAMMSTIPTEKRPAVDSRKYTFISIRCTTHILKKM